MMGMLTLMHVPVIERYLADLDAALGEVRDGRLRTGEPVIIEPGLVFFTPRVETPGDTLEGFLIAGNKCRSTVAHPMIVDRKWEKRRKRSERCMRIFLALWMHDNAHRFKSGNCFDDVDKLLLHIRLLT